MRYFCRHRYYSITDGNAICVGINNLKEVAQKFFSWGEIIGNGRLDQALQQSGFSKEIVVELLRDVGYVLTSGKSDHYCLCVLPVSTSVRSST